MESFMRRLKLSLVCCISSLLLATVAFGGMERAQIATPTRQQIENAAQNKDHKTLSELLLKAKNQIFLGQLHRIAANNHDEVLLKAIKSSNLYSGERLGLTRLQLVGLALFFQTEGLAQTGGRAAFLAKNQNLPWDVEYSRRSANWYVHVNGSALENSRKLPHLRYDGDNFSLIACANENDLAAKSETHFIRFGSTVAALVASLLLIVGTIGYPYVMQYRRKKLAGLN